MDNDIVSLRRFAGDHARVAQVLDAESVLLADDVGDPVARLAVIVDELGAHRIGGRHFLEIVGRQVDVLEAFLRIAHVHPGHAEQLFDLLGQSDSSTFHSNPNPNHISLFSFGFHFISFGFSF